MIAARCAAGTWPTAAAIVAAAIAGAPSIAIAQEWSVRSGATARGDFNDNYFFTPDNTESAFTLSLTPFIVATRRTETSDVAALLAVGANKVWGTGSNVDYISGRIGLQGTLQQESSVWSGNFTLSRAPSLQSSSTPEGVVLALVQFDTVSVNGAYTYELSDRWSLKATAGGYADRYDSIEGGSALVDNRNHGYSAGGSARYAYSPQTHFTFAMMYSYFTSDIAQNDSVTTVVGAAHQVSPQLSISGTVGYFSTKETEHELNAGRRDQGLLFGGDIAYDISDRTRLVVILSEGLAPSATGTLVKTDNATASLSHRVSDSLIGRFGLSYTRNEYSTGLATPHKNHYYSGEVGVTYRLAERWTLDAGYRYAAARYPQELGDPKSNVAFVNLSYNWPGVSSTTWVGARSSTQDLPGAGPVPLSERPEPAGTDGSILEPFFIPQGIQL